MSNQYELVIIHIVDANTHEYVAYLTVALSIVYGLIPYIRFQDR
jgi:hypothetical protein